MFDVSQVYDLSRILLFRKEENGGSDKIAYGFEKPFNVEVNKGRDLIPVYHVKFNNYGFTQNHCEKMLAKYDPVTSNLESNKIICSGNEVIINSEKIDGGAGFYGYATANSYAIFKNIILGLK